MTVERFIHANINTADVLPKTAHYILTLARRLDGGGVEREQLRPIKERLTMISTADFMIRVASGST